MFSERELDFASKKLNSSAPTSLRVILEALIAKNPSLLGMSETDLLDALKSRSESSGSEKLNIILEKAEKQLAENLRSQEVSDLKDEMSRIVSEYIIVSHKTQAGLMFEVQKLLPTWQPLGGPGAAAFGISPIGGNNYFQALVKYKS